MRPNETLRRLVAGAITVAFLCFLLARCGGEGGWFGGGPEDDGTIIYCADTTGDRNIYRNSMDGSNVVALTTDPADDYYAVVSFQGTRIAFGSTRSGGRHDLWLVDVDGGNLMQLTDSGTDRDHSPRWSSDGTKVAFSAYRPWGTGSRVMLTNADGTGEISLYYDESYDSYAAGFTNVDSKVIFFRTERYGAGGATVFSVDLDGTNTASIVNVQALVGVTGKVAYAMMSRDGQEVVFGYSDYSSSAIYRIHADGTGLQLLASLGHNPRWTSDGRIVFGYGNELWLMNADGTGRQALLADVLVEYSCGSIFGLAAPP